MCTAHLLLAKDHTAEAAQGACMQKMSVYVTAHVLHPIINMT